MLAGFLEGAWINLATEQIKISDCEACTQRAEVHLVATRVTGETREVLVCREHMLDPGPLLDW